MATATTLLCNRLDTPLAIDPAAQACLSWRCDEATSAWQLTIRDSSKALCWDSGQRHDTELRCRPDAWHGKPGERYSWQLQVWNQQGQAGTIAESHFAFGLADREAWSAQFINRPEAPNNDRVSRYRRAIEIDGDLVDARLYGTALGLVRFFINGLAVSDSAFDPGWTDYRQRLHYRCYDCTEQLKTSGAHMLGAEMAGGWACDALTWDHIPQQYTSIPRLLACLVLRYADGRRSVIGTDTTWQHHLSPILHTSLLDGEHCDCHLDDPSWCSTASDSHDWQAAEAWHGPEPKRLLPHPAEPVRVTQRLKPVAIDQLGPQRWRIDLGQNICGRIELDLPDLPPGQLLRLRHAEILRSDGELYTDNLRTAQATDSVVCDSSGTLRWTPHYTFHGFRYLELTGAPQQPQTDHISGAVMHSDCRQSGWFACSDEHINQICNNAYWTQRGNWLDLPTDCPQRDERLGWTGDIQAYCRTALWFADCTAFLNKWLVDLKDAQAPTGAVLDVAPLPPRSMPQQRDAGPAWADAATIVPWTLYQLHGDRTQLAQHWPLIEAYGRFLDADASNGLRAFDPARHHCYGDWLNQGQHTSHAILQQAFYAISTRLVAAAAHELDHADAKRWQQRADLARRAFQEHFIAADGTVHAPDNTDLSQTGQLLALHFDLIDEARRDACFELLCQDLTARGLALATGFVGLPYLLPVLARHGRSDLAYALLQRREFPGWGFSLAHGATTIWERWDGLREDGTPQTAGMNSYSHYAYGSCCQWLFEGIAGLQPSPGFESLTIAPKIGGGLTWAEATHHCDRGEVSVSWRIANDTLSIQVSLPPQLPATLIVPGTGPIQCSTSTANQDRELTITDTACVTTPWPQTSLKAIEA
ncbi:MAG: family 78 glycoside hydrolase catalytic domain [Planctomycetota bacterium]|jgi:alpha-L-rhamnosidase|nr:family 78 glycoside hydrolase catalytic domain [Planctomycetota bacterium]